MRIENLELYEDQLKKCLDGEFENDFWLALNNTIVHFKLTPKHFFDLLSAFKQDVIKSRYKTYDEVIDYCKRSANPVGKIILELFGIREDELFTYSDAICTALQLTNFYQDIEIDYCKNRIYLPTEEMEKFGVELNQFELKQNNTNFEKLQKYQVERTRKLFEEGKKLLGKLPLNLKLQIKMTILGGENILDKIEKINYNVFNRRPILSKIDYAIIFLKGLVS